MFVAEKVLLLLVISLTVQLPSRLSFLPMVVESLVTQLENVVISSLLCFCFDLRNCVYNRLFYTEVAHQTNIDSQYVCWFILFEQLVSIFASWTADRLFGWLFCYLFSLVGWSVGFGWLDGFSSFWCWLTARLAPLRSFHSLVSQNTSEALITKAGIPGVSGHRKFETLLIV